MPGALRHVPGCQPAYSHPPKEGQIRIRGKVTVYETAAISRLSASIWSRRDWVPPTAFRAIAEKLRQGLFDNERKKPIPAMPRHIGITSDRCRRATYSRCWAGAAPEYP